MRKQELIDMVESRLSGGDTPADLKGRYHGAIITNHIETVYNQLMMDAFLASKSNQDFSQLDAYAQNFRDIDILDDADRTLKYSVLPFPPVRLPENLGIRMICPADSLSNPFAHVDSNSQAVFSGLDVGTVDLVPSFWIEKFTGNVYRVYYNGITTEVKVSMLMLLPFSQYDDFDDVPFPVGKDLAAVDMAVERLLGMPPEDTTNDNISRQ